MKECCGPRGGGGGGGGGTPGPTEPPRPAANCKKSMSADKQPDL